MTFLVIRKFLFSPRLLKLIRSSHILRYLMLILVLAGHSFQPITATGQEKPKKDKVKAKKAKESKLLYSNASVSIFSDRVVERDQQAYVGKNQLVNAMQEHIRPYLRGAYPQLKSKTPLLDMLYTVALNDLELCEVDGRHFRISPDFPPHDFFTRDIAYSSMLGANFTHASLIKRHLEITRKQRLALGFRCQKKHIIPFLGDKNEVVEGPLSAEFSNGPIAKRMDDVCWVPGYYEALCVEGSREEFEWLVNTFEQFDQEFYQHFLDPVDGLYRGQSSFIDIGGTGYPAFFDGSRTTTIKALSTNCLYVHAFDILQKAHHYLGNEKEASRYAQKRDDLKAIILKEFLHPDGYYAYFKYPDGSLEPRRENLGMAFLVLFDILPDEMYEQAVGNFEQNDFGNPLLWPFYENTKVYHNKAIWPFANTFYNLAEDHHEQNDEVTLRTFANLARHALWGNFSEVLDYETGGAQYKHARSYTWSAASYLAVIYRILLGITFDTPDVIRLSPHVPAKLGKTLEMKDITFGNTLLNVSISGSGSTIDSFTIDGVMREDPVIQKDGKTHEVAIQLK